jgi:xylulokinase
MSYMGIDIGTSGCKAIVFDATGKPLGMAHRSYALRTPQPGWMEIDSREVIDACCTIIAAAARPAGADPVRALCISSQGEAFTPVSGNGAYLGNAMVSSDSRAAGLIEPFVGQFGLERLYGITGHTPSTLFSLFKLLWLKHHQPELWKQSPRFLCFEDLLHLRLGLEPAMGWPLAGRTMLFDVKKHVWSQEILAALELTEHQLARPLPSGGVAGIIPTGMSTQMGLPPGVIVVTGGHDQTIGALGAGVVEEGAAMYAAGSVECLCPVVSKLTLSPELCSHNLCCYDYSLPDRYTSVAYSLTGSNLLQYFREQFGANLSYDALLTELPIAPTTLLALPYFTPSGTPYFDQQTPGALLGWRLTTSRSELLKALLEGVALEMKLNLALLENSGMKIDRLIATGGGSRNRQLVQLKADVLNKPIETIESNEAGCLGAARLAQSADQGIAVRELVRRELRPERVIRPDPDRAGYYQHKFEQYKLFYSGIKNLAAIIERSHYSRANQIRRRS